MNLAELFTPKWKHPLMEKRLEAVKKIRNSRCLYTIILSDLSQEVRLQAAKNLQEEKYILKVAEESNDIQLRLIAIQLLFQKFKKKNVERFALSDRNNEVRAFSYSLVCSPRVCMKIVEASIYPDDRIKALDDIKDPSILKQLSNTLINDKSKTLRLKYVSRLEDQSILAKFAAYDSDEDIRREAIRRINDGSHLYNIVLNDSSEDFRLLALQKVSNFDILLDILKKTTAESIIHVVIEKILRSIELGKISYEQTILSLCDTFIQKASDEEKISLISKIDNQTAIIRFCASDQSDTVRKAAIEKTTLLSALQDFALKDINEELCSIAINRIDNIGVLVEIIQQSNILSTRLAAVNRLFLLIQTEIDFSKNHYFEQLRITTIDSLRENHTPILSLFFIAMASFERAQFYKKVVSEFYDNYCFKLGEKLSFLFSTHLIVYCLEENYPIPENDIRKLLYLLWPQQPQIPLTGQEFESELEQKDFISENLNNTISLAEEMIQQYNSHVEEYNNLKKRLNFLSGEQSSNRFGLFDQISSQTYDQYNYRNNSIDSILGNQNDKFYSQLEYSLSSTLINERLKELDQIMNKLSKGIEVAESEAKKSENWLQNMNYKIELHKKEIEQWIKEKVQTIFILSVQEDNLIKKLSSEDKTILLSCSDYVHTILSVMKNRNLLYSGNCFCDNLNKSLGMMFFAQRIRSTMIRLQADFLKSVYKSTIIKMGDESDSTFSVDGPTAFILINNIEESDVRFLIVGKTVDQIQLKPSRKEDDSTTIQVKAGKYTVACEPMKSSIDPLILEGLCLPGKSYPIRIVLQKNSHSQSNNAPHNIGEGLDLEVGLFGAIPINPTQPLIVSSGIEQWTIGKYCGEGSGGIVYQLINQQTKKQCAFKFLTSTTWGGNTQIEIGRREWENYKQLLMSDHLTGIHDFKEIVDFYQEGKKLEPKKQIAAYSMDFSSSGSLKSWIDNSPEESISFRKVLEIMDSICIGVEILHSSGYIHRDLRPDNILVFETYPNFRICDYSLLTKKSDLYYEDIKSKIAKAESYLENMFHTDYVPLHDKFDDRHSSTSLETYRTLMNASTFYASPEEHTLNFGLIDEQSDIYYIGGIFYWLLIGFDPYELAIRIKYPKLYDNYLSANDNNILHLDWQRRVEFFGKLRYLRRELLEASLELKTTSKMEISKEEIGIKDFDEEDIDLVREIVCNTLNPDKQERYSSVSELHRAIRQLSTKYN